MSMLTFSSQPVLTDITNSLYSLEGHLALGQITVDKVLPAGHRACWSSGGDGFTPSGAIDQDGWYVLMAHGFAVFKFGAAVPTSLVVQIDAGLAGLGTGPYSTMVIPQLLIKPNSNLAWFFGSTNTPGPEPPPTRSGGAMFLTAGTVIDKAGMFGLAMGESVTVDASSTITFQYLRLRSA